MQLFTIGISLQNDDGTLVLDENGKKIATYTNFEISEYAKVYVGLKEQYARGNIEGRHNQIDPLRVDPLVKDHFPKVRHERCLLKREHFQTIRLIACLVFSLLVGT